MRSQNHHSHTSPAEWVVAALSGILVLGVIGFLVYDAVALPSTPPDVRVVVDSITRGSTQYVIHFTARNDGGSTAADVQVSAENRDPATGAVIERSSVVIPYLSAGSRERGGLYFRAPVTRERLTARAEGFGSP